ncbi:MULTISPECIES: MurR/RpiR family transcriptional regulator [unclassified Mesorhizobium]|uniref:MurR/RpiR family transcriptional regulator n=1 Tax=unclassified Mesorhizobium TaxID=325217 RepID=UPI000FCBE5D8|nr:MULTISPECIES: MurR/RpiR family transcriptional regulator [unclassified Mesorhizobium]RUW37047.1 MurR/RpiR family transcriptional regulator [Mesorhizobium sp. M1E.F.Ca.ET.041.01.1.1]RWB55435.1 MAG: MurR/RpiR family transcriptional regulator [Mesorhizobium sp.]RWD90782.1 MAG: MurR/RpiR family transcriptional regulator [Mesorhizobium sp.]RWD92055.1 MAG: MurR/RpiR family transcriptional regulator [Mesorhizobium sp.]TIV55544.1 MAG: MurR/RpiR family transcriptional regulator [Mesorhizobium sp.]
MIQRLATKDEILLSSSSVVGAPYDVEELLLDQFEEMPQQLKLAAKYMLDHPADVAFCSMREMARKVAVGHTTMMRLAHWIGFDGYEEIRSRYRAIFTAGNIRPPVDAPPDWDVQVGFDNFIVAFARQTSRLALDREFSQQLVNAAQTLARASRIFCLGPSSQYAVAHQFTHALSYFRKPAILLDDTSGTGMDALWNSSPDDALLLICTAPYARSSVEVARKAARRGLAIVAITDDRLSPVASLARVSILVPLPKRFYFQSITPVLAAAEILAGLIAQRSNAQVDDPAKLALARCGSGSVALEREARKLHVHGEDDRAPGK